mmetsp:Transcript_7295/g.12867  ORF Transcript_7295/g.12867 Transcript_7295/m.12867 type:complete len:274 (+) Transcript_7295:1368-2189(+)
MLHPAAHPVDMFFGHSSTGSVRDRHPFSCNEHAKEAQKRPRRTSLQVPLQFLVRRVQAGVLLVGGGGAPSQGRHHHCQRGGQPARVHGLWGHRPGGGPRLCDAPELGAPVHRPGPQRAGAGLPACHARHLRVRAVFPGGKPEPRFQGGPGGGHLRRQCLLYLHGGEAFANRGGNCLFENAQFGVGRVGQAVGEDRRPRREAERNPAANQLGAAEAGPVVLRRAEQRVAGGPSGGGGVGAGPVARPGVHRTVEGGAGGRGEVPSEADQVHGPTL